MRTMRIPALALCTFMFPTLAAASPTYQAGSWNITDGETYDASQFSGASVTVMSGAVNISPGTNLVSVYSWFTPGGGPITMAGGQVRDISAGLYGVSISGGQIGLAGASPGYGGLETAGQSVITGGTFTGAYGNSYFASGSAVVGEAGNLYGTGNTATPFMSTLKISGGTFIGGSYVDGYNPLDPRGVLSGYSLVSEGNTTVSGGKFLSPILINGLMGGETDFIGKNLTFQSGVLSGLLQNGDSINVQVSAQSVNAIVNSTGTEVSFVSTVPPPSASSLLTAQPWSQGTEVPEPTSVWIFGVLAFLGLSRGTPIGAVPRLLCARGCMATNLCMVGGMAWEGKGGREGKGAITDCLLLFVADLQMEKWLAPLSYPLVLLRIVTLSVGSQSEEWNTVIKQVAYSVSGSTLWSCRRSGLAQ